MTTLRNLGGMAILLAVGLPGCAAAISGKECRITSDPPGAQVINSDGEPIGRTPLSTTGGRVLPFHWASDGINTAGMITLRREGCEDVRRRFMETSVPEAVHVKLQCSEGAGAGPETAGRPNAGSRHKGGMLAVLEFTNEARADRFEVELLADDVRGASLALPRGTFRVMTRESMMALVPPGTDLGRCSGDSCEVEAGRMVGADLVVAGSLGRFAGDYVVTMKLFDTHNANLLARESATGSNLKALRTALQESSRRLFKALGH